MNESRLQLTDTDGAFPHLRLMGPWSSRATTRPLHGPHTTIGTARSAPERPTGLYYRATVNRLRERSIARAVSTARSRGDALVTSPPSSSRVTRATSSVARSKAARLASDGRVEPLTLRTYWSAAARTSSSVAGGSKLNSRRMLRHIRRPYPRAPRPAIASPPALASTGPTVRSSAR